MLVCGDNDPRGSGTIWMLDLAAPIEENKPLLPATFHSVTRESVLNLAEAGGGVSLEELPKRLETGRRCYAAWVEGQLAAYGWVSLEDEWIGELRLRLRLQPGEAYIWDCFTLPAFRQRYLYTSLLSNILSVLRGEQLRRAWIGTNNDNLASQRGIARAGFQPVAGVAVQRILALRMVWLSGLPGVPDSLVAQARRVFLNGRDQIWLGAPAAAYSYLQPG